MDFSLHIDLVFGKQKPTTTDLFAIGQSTASTAKSSMGILKRLVIDGLAVFAAYTLNFIVCDLVYHDFDVLASLKGSFWFIVGPILYLWNNLVPWFLHWISNEWDDAKAALHDLWVQFLESAKTKITTWVDNNAGAIGKAFEGPLLWIIDWLEGSDQLFTSFVNVDLLRDNVREDLQYLKKIKRY